MFNKTSGNHNVAVGSNTLQDNFTGSENTALGKGAGVSNNGSYNVFVGRSAGSGNTGSRNVFLGYTAGSGSGNVSNKLYVHNSNTNSPLIYGEFDSLKAKINGRFYVSSLATSSSAPVTSGTTKVVVTDQNGLLSYGDVELSNSQSFLSSDVSLSANTYSDAVSLSLPAGTWMIAGTVTVASPANTGQRVTYKVWDGSTVYQAGEGSSNAMGSGVAGYVNMPISCLIVLPATTTIKISVASTEASVIKATPGDNNSGTTNKATGLNAIRIK